MLIPSSTAAAASPVPSSQAGAPASASAAARGDFTAILAGAAGEHPTAPIAASPAATVPAAECPAPSIGPAGNGGGKGLPDIAGPAPASPPASPPAAPPATPGAGEGEESAAPADALRHESDADPANALLAVLALLPPMASARAEHAGRKGAPAASRGSTAIEAATLPLPGGRSFPASAAATGPAIAAAIASGGKSGLNAAAPVAMPALAEPLRLGPIDIAPVQPQDHGRGDGQTPAQTQVKPTIATAPIVAVRAGAAGAASSIAGTAAAQAGPSAASVPPRAEGPSQTPADAGERASAAAGAGVAPASPPGPGEAARFDPPSPTVSHGIPPQPALPLAPDDQPAAATPEAPRDFATLVGRIAEAREAAGAHVVRTAIYHTEFGSVSLQFRPEGAGLAVTVSSADPAFATAVHAGVAASLAGQAGANPNDGGGSEGRQAWQQPAGNAPTQSGGGFAQDQRHPPAQSGFGAGGQAAGQDGQRHQPLAARNDPLGRAREEPAARPARPDRGGIYA